MGKLNLTERELRFFLSKVQIEGTEHQRVLVGNLGLNAVFLGVVGVERMLALDTGVTRARGAGLHLVAEKVSLVDVKAGVESAVALNANGGRDLRADEELGVKRGLLQVGGYLGAGSEIGTSDIHGWM